MGKSNNKNYIVDYGIVLFIVIVAGRIRQYSEIYVENDTGITLKILGTVAFCIISIFGLALILKLILNRNGVQPDFRKLISKVALSLVPILIIKPLISNFTALGWHELYFFVTGFVILFFIIAFSYNLSYRKSFFIAGFSIFAYFVLMTIF